MSFFSFIPFIGSVLDKILPDRNKVIDQNIEEEKSDQARTNIVLAESKGNVFQRSWRPLLIYIFIIVLINNVLFVPILGHYFGLDMLVLQFPEHIPNFVTFAVTGYIGARSLEKITNNNK